MSGERGKEWRQGVANEMIRLIEAGAAPWQKPWRPGAVQVPHNPTTNRPYTGFNAVWLESRGYADPRWMTYRQASAAGAQVRAGETSTRVEYWKWTEERPRLDEDGRPLLDENGHPELETVRLDRPRAFRANVFNAEQIDGLEPYRAPELTFEPAEEAEKVLAEGGVEILHDQNGRAFYSPASDQIRMPPRQAFDGAHEYYAAALHELGRATGHGSRLDRPFGPFGSEVKAGEELRAELTSYRVARELGLGHRPERHASHAASWVKAIREDRNFLFRAARDADVMAEWIRDPSRRQALEKRAQEKREATKMEHAPTNDNRPDRGQETAPAGNETARPKRIYLAVPYEDRDRAKALGAKWASKRKCWYVLDNKDPAPFSRWRMESRPEAQVRGEDPVKAFGRELRRQGVVLDGDPVMDGKWRRVAFDADGRGAKNGSYRGFLDGRPNGQLKNLVSGELSRWIADGEALSAGQVAALKAEAAQRLARRDEEQQARHLEVSARSEQKFFAAALPSGHIWIGPGEAAMEAMKPKEKARWKDMLETRRSEKYLLRKDVDGIGIREHDDHELLVPMRDIDGKIWSLQTIDPDGAKRFEKDGRKTGLMHVINPENKINERRGPQSKPGMGKGSIFIAESYATAASIYHATRRPVVVAFDAGNLKPVAEAVRGRYPDATIVLAADDDHRRMHTPAGNVGWKHAAEAAEKIGGYVVTPEFTDDQKALNLTDWNDLANAHGDDGFSVLADQINTQLRNHKAVRLVNQPKVAGMEV